MAQIGTCWNYTSWNTNAWKANSWYSKIIPPVHVINSNGRYILLSNITYTIAAKQIKVLLISPINSLQTSRDGITWSKVTLDSSKTFTTKPNTSYIRSVAQDSTINVTILKK